MLKIKENMIPKLPVEILINVFLCLDDESYQNLLLTCRKLLFIGTSEESLNKKFMIYFKKNIYLNDDKFLSNNKHIKKTIYKYININEIINKEIGNSIGWDKLNFCLIVGYCYYQYSIFYDYICDNNYNFNNPIDNNKKTKIIKDILINGFIDAFIVWNSIRNILSLNEKKIKKTYKYEYDNILDMNQCEANNLRLCFSRLLIKGCFRNNKISKIELHKKLPQTIYTKSLDSSQIHCIDLYLDSQEILILIIHTTFYMFGLVEAITKEGKYIKGTIIFKNENNGQLLNIRKLTLWNEFDENIIYKVEGVQWDDENNDKSESYFNMQWKKTKWEIFNKWNSEECFSWNWTKSDSIYN